MLVRTIIMITMIRVGRVPVRHERRYLEVCLPRVLAAVADLHSVELLPA